MKKTLISLCAFLLGNLAFGQAPQAPLADRNYADLLSKSLRFFDAQACGPNVSTYSSFDWRGACHVNDGNTVIGESATYNLTGGWHDAGDHVKFNYPMSFAVYSLASLYVDYRAQIDATGNREALLKHLRFVGDYMIKCHPEPNKYVIQIATGERDHRQPWQVPETNTYQRRVYFADLGQPNTNLACSNAAAFASLSMAFRGVDNNYSAKLLQHARDLYNFGYRNQRSYNANTELPSYEFNLYKDNNDFQDEIMIGAAWLYRATGEQRYRNELDAAYAAKGNYLGGWAPGWGDYHYDAVFQMARATGEAKYRNAVGRYVTGVLNGSEGRVSPGGMWYVRASADGFHLPGTLNLANLVYQYADLVGSSDPNYQRMRAFTFSQINYTLGDNPRNSSYVVDFGNNFPRITHHRSASAGNGNAPQDPRILTGALVMGPLGNDQYLNTRSEIKCTEPALGNNASLALAATLMVKETGGTAPPPSTGNVTVRARGTTGSEQIEIRYKDQRAGAIITLSTSFQEYSVPVANPNGNFKVAFLNDNGSRDVEVDWLTVGTTRRQAETRSINTAVWQNNSCGGSNSSLMNCNGYIDFGTLSALGSNAPIGQTIWLRSLSAERYLTANLDQAGSPLTASWATSVQDWERFEVVSAQQGRVALRSVANSQYVAVENSRADKLLRANRAAVGGWEQYEWVSNSDGTVSLRALVNGRYVRVTASGAVRATSAEITAEAKFSWGTSSTARTGAMADKERVVPGGAWQEPFRVYPNPAAEHLTVEAEGQEAYQIMIYDLSGRKVLERDALQGSSALDVSDLRPGVYLLKLRDSEQHELRQRILIE